MFALYIIILHSMIIPMIPSGLRSTVGNMLGRLKRMGDCSPSIMYRDVANGIICGLRVPDGLKRSHA